MASTANKTAQKKTATKKTSQTTSKLAVKKSSVKSNQPAKVVKTTIAIKKTTPTKISNKTSKAMKPLKTTAKITKSAKAIKKPTKLADSDKKELGKKSPTRKIKTTEKVKTKDKKTTVYAKNIRAIQTLKSAKIPDAPKTIKAAKTTKAQPTTRLEKNAPSPIKKTAAQRLKASNTQENHLKPVPEKSSTNVSRFVDKVTTTASKKLATKPTMASQNIMPVTGSSLKARPANLPESISVVTEPVVIEKKRPVMPLSTENIRLVTEQELLKMSEEQYMNQEQLVFFKRRLQQLEQELLHNVDETTEHLRESAVFSDPADRATIEEEHALELRTRDRERKLLKKIQQAITRIDSGEYGWCEETGEPIGIARLLARPTATLSLEAQQRREMKQKLYGD